MNEQLRAIGLTKAFTLHNQGSLRLQVLDGIDLAVAAGECVVLNGPSGAGKSTLLRALYGNYLVQQGRILVRHGSHVVDMAAAPPRLVLDVRRRTMGFVSQFLRVIPRVATIDLVAEPLRRLGMDAADARQRGERLLAWRSPAACGACRRRPSRAASSSASTSPAGSPPNTRSCCSTSRPRRLTQRTATRSST
jgi:alpha-D-ribose 1-methylphosphonate 5-triphosphate synthase subunit PhnL